MPRRAPLLGLAVAALLAGCSSPKPDPQKLANACQIVKCICTPERAGIGNPFQKKPPVDPIWQEGRASCPAGHILERRDAPSMYDRPLY